MQLVVATIGKAHGLRGEVSLILRTDIPEQRLVPGEVFATEPAAAGPLTVESVRVHQGRWLVAFVELPDRTAAEQARGIDLVVEAEASAEDDAWYPHELAGMPVYLQDGAEVGRVSGIDHLPAHDLLVIRETLPDGTTARTLIPLVEAIVPVVDLRGNRIVLTPPGGLLARDAAAAED